MRDIIWVKLTKSHELKKVPNVENGGYYGAKPERASDTAYIRRRIKDGSLERAAAPAGLDVKAKAAQ